MGKTTVDTGLKGTEKKDLKTENPKLRSKKKVVVVLYMSIESGPCVEKYTFTTSV